jgi:DNA-binding transcriptional regulator PaaX
MNTDFKDAYHLSVTGAVFGFPVLRDGYDFLGSSPYPSLSGIRDLAYYAGISDSAIRTALSRANRNGLLKVSKDAAGITRYRLSDPKLMMSVVNSRKNALAEGFIVAVFSFTKDTAGDRTIVREALRNFGFRKIAQNTYINGRIDTAVLMQAMKALGLDTHLYLFTCPDIDNPDLLRRILDLFDIPRRTAELNRFYSGVTSFLLEKRLSDEEMARRLILAGLVFYERFIVTEPPLPANCLPKEYSFRRISQFYDDRVVKNVNRLVTYYGRVNE